MDAILNEVKALISPKESTYKIPKGCDADENIVFIKALVAIILGSVLVNLWIRVINNITHNFFHINPDSAFWAIVIALFMTGILIVYIAFILDRDTSLQVRSSMTGVAFTTTAAAMGGITAAMATDDIGMGM